MAEDKQNRMAMCLRDAKLILDGLNEPFHVCCGTALGIVRDGTFIGHDYDIDVAIDETVFTPALVYAFTRSDKFKQDNRFDIDGRVTELSFQHTQSKVRLDVFILFHDGDDKVFHVLWDFNGRYGSGKGQPVLLHFIKYAISKVSFKDMEILCPDKGYLLQSYGETWNTPVDFAKIGGDVYLSSLTKKHRPCLLTPAESKAIIERSFQKKNTALSLENVSKFYINVDTSVHRRVQMDKVCQRENIHVARWNACKPDSPEVKEAVFETHMTPGERGCAASHYKLWKFLMDYKLSCALVFEDDVAFRPGWKDILNVKLAQIDTEDPSWDVLYLYMYAPERMNYNQWIRVTEHWSATAYILSSRGAAFLVQEFEKEKKPSDDMLRRLQKRNRCYGYFPWLCMPREGEESDVHALSVAFTDDAKKLKSHGDINVEHGKRIALLRPEDRNVYK